MADRLSNLLESIRSSLWFWPVVLSICALLLAQGTVRVDHSDWLAQFELAWLYGAGIAGARALLATIATAMISISATVFSVTIVALSLAAGQMGPRLLRTFMRDRGTQVSLSIFIATFVFCVSVLGAVDGSGEVDFVPRASVSTALLLGMTSMAFLIYFIHHVAAAIQAPNVITVVGEEFDDAIDRLFPERAGNAAPPLTRGMQSDLPPEFLVSSAVVPAPRSGYVQRVNGDSLVKVACECDGVIWLAHAPGTHVIAGTEIARVWPGSANGPDASREIQGSITIGAARTPAQDVLYPVRQLTEIAQRALSPGINDPTTAETCVNRLGAGLARLMGRPLPSPLRRDDHGALRLVVQGVSFAQFVAAAFDPIRNFSGNSLQVSLRLASLVAELAPLTRDDVQRGALRSQAEMLERAAADLPEPLDHEAVAKQCRRATEALDRAARSEGDTADQTASGLGKAVGVALSALLLAALLAIPGTAACLWRIPGHAATGS